MSFFVHRSSFILHPWFSVPTILTYHHIAPPPPLGDEHRGLFVSPESFAAQMAYLDRRGYRLVTLDEVRADLLGSERLPRRSVAITFDDGWADNCSNALPVLRRYGFPATVFLVVESIGDGDGRAGQAEPSARHLNRREIVEMLKAGIEFGSHTLSHGHLARIEPKECERELTQSKRRIEELTGREAGWLSYPYGSFSRTVIQAAIRARHLGAVSTIRDNRATSKSLYFLPRVMVMPDATRRHFAYYLSSWYHWVHWFKNRRRWGKQEL